MEAKEAIKKITSAIKVEDILAIDKFDDEYKALIKLIHPDRCSDVGASNAMTKLNAFRDYFKTGKEYKDEAGLFKTNGYFIKHTGTKALLQNTLANFNKLTSYKDEASLHFRKYMPESMAFEGDMLHTKFYTRAVPLSKLTLPQEHVNWVLNRLFEYSSWLAERGFVHAGLNPESVFILPECHGLQVTSFYHLKPIGQKLSTISALYQHWYPTSMFANKLAESSIDIELAKKIAICLLGDPSGSGTKLRKTHNEKVLNFLLTHHSDAYPTLSAYRDLLSKNFKKEFHKLLI